MRATTVTALCISFVCFGTSLWASNRIRQPYDEAALLQASKIIMSRNDELCSVFLSKKKLASEISLPKWQPVFTPWGQADYFLAPSELHGGSKITILVAASVSATGNPDQVLVLFNVDAEYFKENIKKFFKSEFGTTQLTRDGSFFIDPMKEVTTSQSGYIDPPTKKEVYFNPVGPGIFEAAIVFKGETYYVHKNFGKYESSSQVIANSRVFFLDAKMARQDICYLA